MSCSKRSLIAVAMGLSLGANVAFAVPLEGLFTIDPGVVGFTQPPGYIYDPDGPNGPIAPYYYLPYQQVSYISGSTFVMNTANIHLVDPATGRILSPARAFFLSKGLNNVISPGTDGGLIAGTFQNFVLTPDAPNPPTGTGFGTAPASGGNQIIQPFDFFNSPVYIGTNPVSYVTGNSKAAPSFDYDAATDKLTVNLDSWTVMWNGNAFEQGPAGIGTDGFGNSYSFPDIVEADYDPVTRRYSVSWVSRISGGPFNKFQGYWHIEGTHVVPVPAAVWLFGSGLLGLVGLARRKSKSAS